MFPLSKVIVGFTSGLEPLGAVKKEEPLAINPDLDINEKLLYPFKLKPLNFNTNPFFLASPLAAFELNDNKQTLLMYSTASILQKLLCSNEYFTT